MITLHTQRHQVGAFIQQCYGYIDEAKKSWLKNVPPEDNVGFLVQLAFNSVITETQELLLKKYGRTSREMIKIELTVAQSIALYQVLQRLPMPSSNVYLNSARANWIGQLDQALIALDIITPRERPQGVPGAPNYD